MGLNCKKVYLLLGSNLGDRQELLRKAVEEIGRKIGVVFARSSVYQTAAWGNQDQPAFLNIAIGVETPSDPFSVLRHALEIERSLGRDRTEKWGARLIDIDIIFYGNEIIREQDLSIPHPHMQHRRFVLEPLAEIAPDHLHPVLHQKVSDLLADLTDDLMVSKI